LAIERVRRDVDRRVDLLGEITGVGAFDDVSKAAIDGELGGFTVRFMSLDQLWPRSVRSEETRTSASPSSSSSSVITAR